MKTNSHIKGQGEAQIFRGVGWVISLISALMIIYWLLTL